MRQQPRHQVVLRRVSLAMLVVSVLLTVANVVGVVVASPKVTIIYVMMVALGCYSIALFGISYITALDWQRDYREGRIR